MAELTPDKRMIANAGETPNLSGITQSYEKLGQVVDAGFSTVAGIIKHNNQLEEQTMLAGAKTDLERLQIKYTSDPTIGLTGIENYKTEAVATIEGYASKANPAYRKSLKKSLETFANTQATKVLAAGYKETARRAKAQLAEDYEINMSLAGRAVESGDFETAEDINAASEGILDLYRQAGASSKEISRLKQAYNVNYTASHYEGRLRRANSQAELDYIANEVLSLPSDPKNIAAGNRAFALYRKLTSLRKEGEDLTAPATNSLSGQAWKNQTLPKKSSNGLYDAFASNAAINAPNPDAQVTSYDVVPNDIEPTGEDGEVTQNDLTNGVIRTLENVQAEPIPQSEFDRKTDLFLLVGSENTTKYTNELTSKIKSQVGDQVNEASIAVEKITRINPNILNLDQESKMIMSYFNVRKNSAGEGDYQKITDEANELLKMGETKYKEVRDNFNSKFGLAGRTQSKNLKNLFKDIAGVDPDKTFSQEAYTDFYHMLEQNYISIGGHEMSAIDATMKDYYKRHSSDRFSYTSGDIDAVSAGFVNNPISKDKLQQTRNTPTVITGLTENQLQNNLQETLVRFAAKSESIKLPEHYKNVLSATETEKVKNNLSFPAPNNSAESSWLDSSLYITQDIEGIMTEGRVFLKSVPLTMQNNLGIPAWEVWMQDYSGRIYPVRDDSSPSNNTLLFAPKTTAEFVPEYAKQTTQDSIDDTVNRFLAIKGRAMYPYMTMSPVQNYQQRKAYKQDLKNQKEAEKIIRKGLGMPKDEVEE